MSTATIPARVEIAPGVTFDPALVTVGGMPPRPMFIIASGSGFSCLGLDVAKRKASAVMAWIGKPVDLESATPAQVWQAYQSAMAQGHTFHGMTGKRCPSDLCPQLVGLEGKRVEVTEPDGTRRRFIVGKSMGWMPCHLEIARRNSTGGPAAYIPPGSTVRVVG